MKLLTIGIRRNGTTGKELQQQLSALSALPEIHFDTRSSGTHSDVIFAGLYPQDEQVPGILGQLLDAGFELTSLSYNRVAGQLAGALTVEGSTGTLPDPATLTSLVVLTRS